MISSESVGMSRMLGGHVRVTRSMEETADHLQELLGDEEARIREGHLAYRHVHESHTYRHRMDEVFHRVGLSPLGSEQPSVSVLMPTMRPENVVRCLENFTKQAYLNKELILILNNAEFDLDAVRKYTDIIPNVQVLHVEGRTTLGDCLNRGVEARRASTSRRWMTMTTTGIGTYRTAFSQPRSRMRRSSGRDHFFMYFEESDTTALRENTPDHTFTSSALTGGTLFIQTDVAREIPFDSISLKEDTNFQRAAARAGCRIYAADRFNYIQMRTRRLSDHYDQTPDADFLKKCRAQTPGLDLGRVLI